MEKILNLARGCVTAEIRGLEAEELLNRCASCDLRFWKVRRTDEYTIRLNIYKKDWEKFCLLSKRTNCETERVRERGVPGTMRGLRRRAVLFAGLVLFALLMFWGSLHVWEIEVTGNETVSDWEIISALDSIGVGIGSYWPSFVSDNIRSRALVLLPELSFLTVNIKGSRAEVIVRERTPIPEVFEEDMVCDIVAEKAGIITDIRVLNGEKVAVNGQTVAAGDKLVSGAVTSSFAPLRFEHSRAEVYARTWYTLTVQKPLESIKRTEKGETKRSISLILGDKRINFYKSSGIFTPDCVKITLDHYLSVKGVFSLPVGISETRTISYKTETVSIDPVLAESDMQTQLYESLLEEIGEDGSIEDYSFSSSVSDGVLTVTLHAECIEQIGAEQRLSEEDMVRLRAEDINERNEGENQND